MMNLREYLDSLPSIRAWAESHKLDANLLVQYAPRTGKPFKQPGPKMAQRISRASGGLVPLAKLRPDLWG
jgi:hypothetical protein